MMLSFLKCKIHRATVTDANLHYQGSITLGGELMQAAGIQPFEKVEIYNVTNGERFATYAIQGAEGTVCLNGAAAWKVRVSDKIIIAAYCMIDATEAKSFKPTLVYVGPKNEIKNISHSSDSLL